MPVYALTQTIAQAKLINARIAEAQKTIKALTAELQPLEEEIIAAAEKVATIDEKGTRRADLQTPEGNVKITFPIATLKLTEDNLAEAKELAGDAWKKIAEKVAVPFSLVKAARELIPALLPKKNRPSACSSCSPANRARPG